jgi:DNA invertase Pin-like site-specific DNA recombinase
MGKIYKYIRFSTDRQDERQQENTIDSWLKAKGMTADETIRDEAISGGTSYKERNLFQLVRELGLNDTLIVSEISRITRSGFGELNELIQDYFKPNRLRLIICNVGLDIDCSEISAMTELQLSMLSIFAKMEKELIVGRTKSALDTRRLMIERDGGFTSKSGEWRTRLGRPDIPQDHIEKMCQASARARRNAAMKDDGYQNAQKVARDMRERGATLQEICDTLNSLEGMTPRRGSKWVTGQISRVLGNAIN